jgi:hypothetical protein
MLSLARERMIEFSATKIVTGDVLGQRLPGQSKRDFALVDFHAGAEGIVLRPLSGKLLPETGVDRELLLDLQGRGRQRQQALAREWGWTEIPGVTSGCLLADHAYGRKYQDAIEHGDDDPALLSLLAIGRHFRLATNCRVVLGRNATENEALHDWHAAHAVQSCLYEPANFIGPTALALGTIDEQHIVTIARLIHRFGRAQAISSTIRCRSVDVEQMIEVPLTDEPLPPQL